MNYMSLVPLLRSMHEERKGWADRNRANSRTSAFGTRTTKWRKFSPVYAEHDTGDAAPRAKAYRASDG